MARAFFQITAQVAIAGNPPGKLVQIEIDADGVPTELYWRKRVADGDATRYVPSPASEPEPTAPPASAKKKGA